MLRFGPVLAVVALGAQAAFAQESGRAPAVVDDDVKQGVQAILTLCQAGWRRRGSPRTPPMLRYARPRRARPTRRTLPGDGRGLVLDVQALDGAGPVDVFCEAGRGGWRLAYWTDEIIAVRADRPAFLKPLFTHARAGMADVCRRRPQTGDAMP